MKPAARAWNGLLIGLTTLFVLNVGLMIAAVATSSFARRWLGTWLPDGLTTGWYAAAWFFRHILKIVVSELDGDPLSRADHVRGATAAATGSRWGWRGTKWSPAASASRGYQAL